MRGFPTGATGFIVTSGTAMANLGQRRPATENGPPASWQLVPRAASEEAAASAAARGAQVLLIRLPHVHDTRKQGVVTYAIPPRTPLLTIPAGPPHPSVRPTAR